MPTAAVIVLWILAIAIAIANGAYWWWVVRRGEARFRARCARRYGVQITTGMKGHWKVVGPRSWWSRLGIELLQLVYFLGAMVVWGAAMIGAVLVLSLVQGGLG